MVIDGDSKGKGGINSNSSGKQRGQYDNKALLKLDETVELDEEEGGPFQRTASLRSDSSHVL